MFMMMMIGFNVTQNR